MNKASPLSMFFTNRNVQFGQNKVPLQRITRYEVLDRNIVRLHSDTSISAAKVCFDLMCETAENVDQCVQGLRVNLSFQRQNPSAPLDSETAYLQIYRDRITFNGNIIEQDLDELVNGIKGSALAEVMESEEEISAQERTLINVLREQGDLRITDESIHTIVEEQKDKVYSDFQNDLIEALPERSRNSEVVLSKIQSFNRAENPTEADWDRFVDELNALVEIIESEEEVGTQSNK